MRLAVSSRKPDGLDCHSRTFRDHSDETPEGPGLRRGRGRGGRIGRLFAHGDLHLLVLHLIAQQPRHGYEIMKQIEIMVGGEYTPSPGTIYPALTLLDDQEYVGASRDERGKKVYAVTASGAAYLSQHADAVCSMIETMSQISRHGEPGPSPRIRAAMGRLKDAIYMQIENSPPQEDKEERIFRIISQAAQDIMSA